MRKPWPSCPICGGGSAHSPACLLGEKGWNKDKALSLMEDLERAIRQHDAVDLLVRIENLRGRLVVLSEEISSITKELDKAETEYRERTGQAP